ncbi:MAG TPA: hypothetical protein VHO67_03205 [Polyangia bacterium]|nr:hypothetical protein [Polyangia bacterium]
MRANRRWGTAFAAAVIGVAAASAAPAQGPPATAPPCEPAAACAGTVSGGWCVDTFLAGDRTFPQFSGIWSDAPDDVWAVGAHARGGGGFAYHWDGCAWSPAALPGGAATKPGLADVWGAGAQDVWIVGARGAAFHWNGHQWSAAATGAAGTLDHVSGTGSADVWALGTAGLFHWNGRAWSADARFPLNGSGEPVGDVWAAAPDDVWVAGGLNARGSLAHFDGARWTMPRPSPDLAFGLFGIWSDGATTWTAGEGSQVVRKTGGGRWVQLAPPGGSSRGWVNVMGSGNEVWASGQAVGRSTAGAPFRAIAGTPAGFYPGLWLNRSQVWVAGITNAGAAVVLHRAR